MKYVLIDDDPGAAAHVAEYYKHHILPNPRVRSGKQNDSLFTYNDAKWLVWHNEAKTQITVKRTI